MAVASPPEGFIAYGSGMAITLEGRETIRIGDDEKFVPRRCLEGANDMGEMNSKWLGSGLEHVISDLMGFNGT